MKIGLSPDDVKAIEALELPQDSYIHHARNVWLISFYFAGMWVSDVLRRKWSDFQNDRLYYSMGKNDKGGSLKLPEKAIKIISQYEGQNNAHDFVFPDLSNLADLSNNFAIRLSDAPKMANYLLRNSNEWSPEKIKDAMNSGKEQFVKLKNTVPVIITYYTAWVDNKGVLHFANDIYQHDKQMAQKMFSNPQS